MKNMCKNMAKYFDELINLSIFVLPNIDCAKHNRYIFSDYAVSIAYPCESVSFAFSRCLATLKGVRSLFTYIFNKTFTQMPNTENVLRKAQGVPSASVEPTKQADNSIPTTSIKAAEIPSPEILAHAEDVSWNWMFKIPDKFTPEPEIYSIEIDGTFFDYNSKITREVRREYCYEEYHPYLAIGRAVYEFMRSSSRSRIYDLRLSKRVIKKKRIAKKQ